MKYLNIFIILLFCSCKTFNNKDVVVEQKNYVITSLDSLNNYYIIYAKQLEDGYNYKIISKKDNSECNSALVIGNEYSLKLTSIFTMKINDNGIIREISNNVNIDCIHYDSTEFCKEYDKGISDVHKSINLRGLCYIKN